MDNIQNMGMSQKGSLVSNKGEDYGVGVVNYYHVECYDIDGNFKWKETIKNLVTTEGLNYIMEASFRNGTTLTAITSWYIGLKGTGAPDPTDAASALPSVGAWAEYETYLDVNNGNSGTTRPALTLDGAFASGTQDNSNTVASYQIESPANDVFGVFLTDGQTKGSASGATVLYGVGNFASQKVVDAGDTLNVTVTLTASSP